ncbi:hypothetical protein FQA39_LY07793 [Lamprigera yunnana]|nr:hypothetical protein FQA39_LY07793 [Lamprigera yunnana]
MLCALFQLFVYTKSDEQCFGEKKEPICVTPGCVRAALGLINTIDETVDPCDDFYQFACGTFLKKTIIPEDELIVMKNIEVQNEVIKQLRVIIEEPLRKNEPKCFVLLKKIYNVCMDLDAIEREGLNGIKRFLFEIGGWPILNKHRTNDTQFKWEEMVYKIRKTGFYQTGFYNLYIGTNILNTTQNIIILDEGYTTINKEYLVDGFKNPIVKAYYNFMLDFAIILGADPNCAKKEVKNIINFEVKLAKILLPNEERRNMSAMTHHMTIEELETSCPYFPWLEYIKTVLNIPHIQITRQEVVDVVVPSYIPKLEALLDHTSKRTQKNYIAWVFLEELAAMLPQYIRNLKFNFNQVLSGVEEIPPRWKQCVIEVNARMNVAMSALYVRRYFNEDSKKNVVEMIDNLQCTFVKILNGLDWMDDSTRAKAVEKAKAMVNHVAYPQELMDNKKIEEYYADFKFSNNYLMLYLNYQQFYLEKLFGNLRKPINKTEWFYHASSTAVNAFYSVSENGIELPAGILQDVFYSKDRPQYMNYAGIGFIIGHEITHGFDDQGRQTNKDGALIDWWTKETEHTFIEKSKCIIEQYGNFTIPNSKVKINGINTQGENIADNGALKIAYLAYLSWVRRNNKEPLLPGLNYTQNQIFWLTIGNIWCSKERPELLEKMAITASHSPSYFRVLGSMRNSKHFAKDFDCPVGSKMNPIQKCSVW